MKQLETPDPARIANCIWHRKGTRNIWFRHWVPKRYRTIEPLKLIQKSLGTADKGEARLRAAAMLLELHQGWEERVSGSHDVDGATDTTPTELDLQLAATEATYIAIQPKLDRLWEEKRCASEESYNAALESVRRTRSRYVRTRQTDTLDQWQRIADRELERRGWHLRQSDHLYAAFVQMLAEAAIDVLGVEIAKREGRFGENPSSPTVISGLAVRRQKAVPGETITELFERYATQRLAEKRKRQDTIDQDRKIISGLADFLGKERSARSISPTEIREWRDTVAALPVSYKTAKTYIGLSMREAATKAKLLDARAVSPTTVNKYLSTASPFLAWCVTNAFADSNPCDGLFYDIQKGKNPRPPFTDEQLRKIFQSPLFSGFEADGKEHRPGTKRADDWRYWIPLLCLFTGARIGEVAQLRIEDVAVHNGVSYVLIRHDEREGQSTKSGQSRTAPIHSKLQELGFLAFVSRRRTITGTGPLFPELKPNDRGQISAIPSRFWRDYLTHIGVKGARDGYGAHSFRHTVADLLRQADYLDDEIEVALGHNQKTVTSGYGQVRQGTVARISLMLESTKLGEIMQGIA